MTKRIIPLLAAALAAHAAWAETPRERADPRVPPSIAGVLSARAEERGVPPSEVLAPVAEAVSRGVPPDLVAAKVLEGLSKGVAPARIRAVARDLTARLALSDGLLQDATRAGLAPAGDRRAALLDLCAALAAGVAPDAVAALVDAAHSGRGGSAESVVSGAQVTGELMRRGVPSREAMELGLAIARSGPRPAGEIPALFDAWRSEGGKDARGFVQEAARRIDGGRKLDGMVDSFGEAPNRIVGVRDHGQSRERDPGEIPGSDVGKHGADKGVGPAERPGTAQGAVPGLDDIAHGKGKAKGKTKE